MHLLTREATALYQRVKPGGLLVFHISNRYFDLQPALGNITHDLGLTALVQYDRKPSAADGSLIRLPSTWLVMARDLATLKPIGHCSQTHLPLQLDLLFLTIKRLCQQLVLARFTPWTHESFHIRTFALEDGNYRHSTTNHDSAVRRGLRAPGRSARKIGAWMWHGTGFCVCIIEIRSSRVGNSALPRKPRSTGSWIARDWTSRTRFSSARGGRTRQDKELSA